jgi:carbon-monoxide dehydrogenase medium subunit
MRAAYRAFGQLERPAAGVAAVCTDNGGALAWRFWVGALCAPPTRLTALEELCAGVPAHALPTTIEQHAPALCAVLDAQDDLHGSADYKRHLASVLVHRAAKACLA